MDTTELMLILKKAILKGLFFSEFIYTFAYG